MFDLVVEYPNTRFHWRFKKWHSVQVSFEPAIEPKTRSKPLVLQS